MERALFDLSHRYARAADARDRAAFLAVFAPDAVLRVMTEPEGGDTRVIVGHGQLAAIPRALARYDKTFHLLGQAAYDVADDRATGEVHCVAHHLTTGPGGAENLVMYIRYADTYERAPSGAWWIVERDVRVDWTEARRVDLR